MARRTAHQVAEEVAGFRQGWVRDLFTEFCAWDRLCRARGDMPRHIAAYARCFRILDLECPDVGAITQVRLIELYGAEAMRRGFQVVAFLMERLSLDWDPTAVVDATERGRMAATMAAAAGEPWAPDLEAYRAHLAAGRKLAAGTARMYVAAAAALLRASGVERASELTQRHVARHLRRSPGRRTNLLRFLSWIAGQSADGLTAGPERRTPARKREKATLRRAGHLMDRLAAIRDPREGRAVLATAIAVLHHVPLARILALAVRDVAHDGDVVVLWPGKAGVRLAAPLAVGFARFAAPGRLAFPGRNGMQPLTVSAVRHHVRPIQAARTTIRPLLALRNELGESEVK